MKTVLAYAAPGAHQPLQPTTIQRRALGADDVAIDIQYCGVCHSDVSMVADTWGFGMFPMVPGHEITGIVSAVGPEVRKFAVGDRVGVGCFVDSCTTCATRNADLEHLMPGLVQTYNSLEADGVTVTSGGYSQAIVVREGYVLAIPERLAMAAAAPLLCAGVSMYSPLRRFQAGPGKRVAIVGMGGLGHVGVKLAHAMGAEVTVLSQSLAKEDDARRFGARHYYATADATTFSTLAGTLDLIICTATTGVAWNAYLDLLKIDGAMVLIGVPPEPVPVSALSLLIGRRTLTGSLMGSIRETQEMLEFCAKNGVSPEIEIIAVQDINTAYRRMERGDVRYRFVIDISTFKGQP